MGSSIIKLYATNSSSSFGLVLLLRTATFVQRIIAGEETLLDPLRTSKAPCQIVIVEMQVIFEETGANVRKVHLEQSEARKTRRTQLSHLIKRVRNRARQHVVVQPQFILIHDIKNADGQDTF